MQIGSQRAINRYIVVLSLLRISSANILTDVPKNNPLNIDWYPAPSPEEGPPLSAGASRDKALLPAQIGGILGAYLFTICIVGIGIILVGRRFRLRLQKAQRLLDIELNGPLTSKTNKTFDHFNGSPISPGLTPGGPRNFWPTQEKDRNPYVFPNSVRSLGQSPTTPTSENPYIDPRIVEADRDMLQRDLEDIYAHVMAQEEAKAAGVKLEELPLPPQLQRVGPVPAPAPQREQSPIKQSTRARPSNLSLIEESKSTKSRTSSLLSSLKSPRFGRKSKDLQISSPILTPTSAQFQHQRNASDEEPLSPRYYTPPPPPPVPRDQAPYSHSRDTSSGPASPTRSIAEQLAPHPYGQTGSQRHRPNQSQTSVQTTNSQRNEPPSATSATSLTPLFNPPPPVEKKLQIQLPPKQNRVQMQSLNMQSTTPSYPPPQFNQNSRLTQTQINTQANAQTSQTRALPFRQFEPPLASPSYINTTTKTTVLDRGPERGGPQTAGLRTPWSAGAVPYSPYQPFSPMMPITPRLVTKEDRKKMEKMQKKCKTPTTELIRSEDDIWDSGY